MQGTRLLAARPSGPGRTRIKKKIPFLALIVLFFLGMVYGVLLFQSGSISVWLQFFVGEYTAGLAHQSVVQSFTTAFGSAFLFLLTSYLLGYSAVGIPFVLLIPFFKGLGLGGLMAYLYWGQGFRGFGYCVLILLPYTVVALIAIIIGCRESIRLSAALFSSFLPNRGHPLGADAMKLYHIKFLVLSGFAIVSALLHTICVLLFSGMFQF